MWIWNHIDHVEITPAVTLGAENRAAFHDDVTR
jgi:glucose-6-phosphate 1-dehydrogenase